MAGAGAKLQVAHAEISGRLHAAFRDLVSERCLERCRPCDLPRVMPRVRGLYPEPRSACFDGADSH